ncbi:division/cell wall cluster transcriptional repressor MraZ [Duganella sp. FT50W]|uniref:Transcriptional regulator MraZ n=1 Tax=Duganella lactea TaxID=2692173 RepID=A0A6L8MHI0_9BURK|nr:division/cell wall cluster transcriptional repressor MraZ [Duganella lactea]MYM81342.1 division/cell wall cluster transcriptional repressor MraZ [Duganella lactea]
MFQGASAINLDAKGRMSIPAKHRDALSIQCEGRLTLTRHPDGCVMLFPRPVWEQHRQQITAWPLQARAWQRIFLGYATDVDMDTAGRILISPELRAAVGLEKEVMMMGMGSHFEIWDAAKMAEKEQQALDAGTPEALANFSF